MVLPKKRNDPTVDARIAKRSPFFGHETLAHVSSLLFTYA